jgi:hypothetical protein
MAIAARQFSMTKAKTRKATAGWQAAATAAVIRVGDGREFIIAHKRRIEEIVVSYRLVVTAAHCLRKLPPPHGGSYISERTYPKLLAPLDHKGKPTVWAECLFVDPVADIAVLGTPDGQAFPDQEYEVAYDELVDPITPLKIGKPAEEGWLLGLDGVWFRCAVRGPAGPYEALVLTDMAGEFIGGMSGSPIVSTEGAAIGVACLGSIFELHGPNPSLVGNLPGWLLTSPRPHKGG